MQRPRACDEDEGDDRGNVLVYVRVCVGTEETRRTKYKPKQKNERAGAVASVFCFGPR